MLLKIIFAIRGKNKFGGGTMKIYKTFLITVLITLFTGTTAFAVSDPLSLNLPTVFTNSKQHFKKGYEQKSRYESPFLWFHA
jgi:hypothetical protein